MKTVDLNTPASREQAIRDGQSEDVLVLRDGKPVAMVVPFDEGDLEWYAREHAPDFIDSIARAREQVRSGKSVSHEQLKSDLGL